MPVYLFRTGLMLVTASIGALVATDGFAKAATKPQLHKLIYAYEQEDGAPDPQPWEKKACANMLSSTRIAPKETSLETWASRANLEPLVRPNWLEASPELSRKIIAHLNEDRYAVSVIKYGKEKSTKFSELINKVAFFNLNSTEILVAVSYSTSGGGYLGNHHPDDSRKIYEEDHLIMIVSRDIPSKIINVPFQNPDLHPLIFGRMVYAVESTTMSLVKITKARDGDEALVDRICSIGE